MKAFCIAAALATVSAARAEEAPPAATKASIELPQVAAAPRGAAPNALPPVTARLFHIGGLLEVQPALSISVGDPFYRTWAAGIRGEHHFDERWSVSAHVFAGASSIAAPLQICGDGPCSLPVRDQLRSTPGQLQLMAGAELGWAPIYGKLSLIGERTLHFDAYVSAGPELLRERIAPDAASPLAGRWEPGLRVSVGERVFVTDRLAVRLAASELVYAAHVRGRTEFERKLSIEGGLSWLFGGAR